MRNMSLKSSSNNNVNVIGKIIPFCKLGDLRVGVHFGVMDEFEEPLLVGKLFLERFIKAIFTIKRPINPIPSHFPEILPGGKPPYDLLKVRRQNYSLSKTLRAMQRAIRTKMATSPYFELQSSSQLRLLQKCLFQSPPAALDLSVLHLIQSPCAIEWPDGTHGL